MRPDARVTAAHYQPEDLVTFRKGIEALGLSDGSTGIVTGVDARRNLLTVLKRDGEEVSYNPARYRSETMRTVVERHERRDFAVGERVQFTASDRALGVKAGDLGTVESIAGNRSMGVQLDNGKSVDLSAKTSPNIDYGYVVDGSTVARAYRVLVSIALAPQLTGESKTVQSISAAKQEAVIFTSDAGAPGRAPMSVEQVKDITLNPQPVQQTEKGEQLPLPRPALQKSPEVDASQTFAL